MPSAFIVFYSAYDRRLQVLHNGKSAISDTSPLLQFKDESFSFWCCRILEVLYHIARENFDLEFIGRQDEVEVMNLLCEGCPYCKIFKYGIIDTIEDLEDKMRCLGTLLRKYDLSPVKKEVLNVSFSIDNGIFRNYADRIKDINVENDYCRLDFSISGIETRNPDICFCITNNIHNIDTSYNFILIPSNDTYLTAVKENTFVYCFNEDDFFEVIFKCLLLSPLANLFYSFTDDVLMDVKRDKSDNGHRAFLEIKNLVSIYGMPIIQTEYSIEKGTSVPLKLEFSNVDERLQQFEFKYQYPGIVDIQNNRIYGLNTGKTNIYVSYLGGLQTIDIITVSVYFINHIRELHIETPELIIGLGDGYRIGYSYVPANADDIDKIQWYSDNKDIAAVTQSGLVCGNSCGTCEVLCYINDDIWACCKVIVKPYLEDIFIWGVDSGTITLDLGSTIELKYECIPKNSIDEDITVTSSDYLVVNVTENRLEALAVGEANIVVENISRSVQRSFAVKVQKPKKQGILQKIWR